MAGRVRRPIDSRGDNPTVAAFEEKLAALEGAEAARGFASGMAAISSAVLSNLGAGERMVCVRHCYPDVGAWLERIRALPGWVHAYELMPGYTLPAKAD